MKGFKVKGKFLMGDRWQEFTKEIAGSDENAVREEIFSRLGSKHRVKRTKIHITDVIDVPISELSDPIVLYQLKSKKKLKRTKLKKMKDDKKGGGTKGENNG